MKPYLTSKGIRASLVAAVVLAIAGFIAPSPYIAALAVVWAGATAWAVYNVNRENRD